MAASKRRRSDRALRPPMGSPGRPPLGRREHRQRFWEEVARGLSSEESAVAAGVSLELSRFGGQVNTEVLILSPLLGSRKLPSRSGGVEGRFTPQPSGFVRN